MQPTHAVQPYPALPVTAPGDGYVDEAPLASANPPRVGARVMARERTLTRRKNRRHDPAARRYRGVPNGVRAAKELVKAPAGEPVLDGGAAKSHRKQLPIGHDTVLPLGELGDLLLTWALFVAYIEGKRAQVGHGPDGGASLVTGQHLL
jgi:hypothetical protein